MSRTKTIALAFTLLALCGTRTLAASPVQQDGPALLEAAGEGRLEAVRRLLDGGVDPTARGELGQTALMLAAGGGHAKIVRLLLDRGADPTVWDDDEDTALGAYAAASGHTEVVKLLLERGASVLVANRDGMTPLMFAALYGRIDAMQLLEAAMLPLAAAQSLSDLADVLSGLERHVDAERLQNRASAIRDAELGPAETASRQGPPPLLMLAGHERGCVNLGFPRLLRCVRVSNCRYKRVGTVRVIWMRVGTDPKELVELFIRDARRLDADAVIDVRVELTPSLGRNRLSRIDADVISFTDPWCKKLARDP